MSLCLELAGTPTMRHGARTPAATTSSSNRELPRTLRRSDLSRLVDSVQQCVQHYHDRRGLTCAITSTLPGTRKRGRSRETHSRPVTKRPDRARLRYLAFPGGTSHEEGQEVAVLHRLQITEHCNFATCIRPSPALIRLWMLWLAARISAL